MTTEHDGTENDGTQGKGPEAPTQGESRDAPKSERLRVVPGSAPSRNDTVSTAPRRALSRHERKKLREALESIEAQVDALNLIEAAYSEVSPAGAMLSALRQAARLGDEPELLKRVMACLAVEAVWMMPGQPTPALPLSAGEIAHRQTQLRIWCWDRRRSAMRRLRAGRRLLRGKR